MTVSFQSRFLFFRWRLISSLSKTRPMFGSVLCWIIRLSDSRLLPVGPGDSCVPQVKVRKNTVVTASCESISCPVTYCEEIPAIAWIKIDNESNYIPISEKSQVTIKQEQNGLNDLVSYLSFKNISTDHNGIYRCMINTSNFSSKSHSINVSIPVSGKKSFRISNCWRWKYLGYILN